MHFVKKSLKKAIAVMVITSLSSFQASACNSQATGIVLMVVGTIGALIGTGFAINAGVERHDCHREADEDGCTHDKNVDLGWSAGGAVAGALVVLAGAVTYKYGPKGQWGSGGNGGTVGFSGGFTSGPSYGPSTVIVTDGPSSHHTGAHGSVTISDAGPVRPFNDGRSDPGRIGGGTTHHFDPRDPNYARNGNTVR